ncbi:hypothetical protein F9K85_16750 [Brucella tritici]|uniref:N-acetyltransferase domain-containing protein n=2 Tax=Brucella/Ochrobactrum group TaxID=2826938 RepID=A0A6L3YAV4_9HYPH|nr:hypothetical protein [Brucella tritici]KAB2661754.1 hypothetical protein F9K91_24245 [Brucella tritici]KAB2674509.1 hypothetical protein F9K85_16750 [Brucella tritici]KAB2680836.1 hypothetical protein F9L08_20870 [Brucella tritici]NKW10306.1 hypothetical protein [Brucella tritici]
MKARTATVGDLESVFHDLSRRMAIEYIAAGKDTKAAYDNLMMNLREGRAHALLQGGKVVAIIAWHEVDGATDTLFAAKEEFFNRNTVRFCKQHIRQIQALAGDLPVHSRSWLDRSDIVKWFKIIGYEEKGTDNGARLFELPARRDGIVAA